MGPPVLRPPPSALVARAELTAPRSSWDRHARATDRPGATRAADRFAASPAVLVAERLVAEGTRADPPDGW